MPYAKSDHYDGKIFHNIDPDAQVDKGIIDVLRWKLGAGASAAATWPKWLPNTHVPQLPTHLDADEVAVTCINHATELIQFNGLNVLTDPVFSKRVSPFSFAGPQRVRPPGLELDALPKIDVVVVSHNHYDHLDMSALLQLAGRQKPLFIVPLGNKALLESAGLSPVIELDWWESHTLNATQRVTLVPAQHWSARGVWDRCQTLWGGYVIASEGMQVFFAGDTGYGPHFKMTQEKLGPMDVALLPIGAYEPRWFMKTQHMNPDDAVRAHLDLLATASRGMHFGTFQLTDEAIDAPVLSLAQSAATHGLEPSTFLPLENGETWRFRRKKS